MCSELIYHNDSDQEVEVVFVFPMDDGSAVYHFEAQIGDKLIVAECQEKKQVIINSMQTFEIDNNCDSNQACADLYMMICL